MINGEEAVQHHALASLKIILRLTQCGKENARSVVNRSGVLLAWRRPTRSSWTEYFLFECAEVRLRERLVKARSRFAINLASRVPVGSRNIGAQSGQCDASIAQRLHKRAIMLHQFPHFHKWVVNNFS